MVEKGMTQHDGEDYYHIFHNPHFTKASVNIYIYIYNILDTNKKYKDLLKTTSELEIRIRSRSE